MILLICITLPATVTVQAQADSAKPNILLLVGDDIGFGDLSFSGAATRTPNLDRLVQRGAFFTSFHVSPLCSVTPSMLLTGCDPIEVGLGAFDYTVYPPSRGKRGYESFLPRDTATIAELLQNDGYRPCMAGKWHLGGAHHGGHGPHEWGFDNSYVIYTGGSNHWNQGVFHADSHDPKVVELIKQGRIPQEPFYENGQTVQRPKGIYSDDLYTSKLLQYLEEGRESGKPFFAYAAYTTAHAPIQAPDFLIDKYHQHYLKLGFEGVHRARFDSQKKLGLIPQDAPYPERKANPLLRAWSELDDEEKQRQARVMATYSAMMESRDYHIGTILNYLKETGELDNTLVIYTSDNGPEGTDLRGELSNPNATKWVRDNFSQELADIGRGNTFHLIGSDWAGAATGSLNWWKWFIGDDHSRLRRRKTPDDRVQKSEAQTPIRDFSETFPRWKKSTPENGRAIGFL